MVSTSLALQINIACQVCAAMEYLARNRVIHRDLAARNVLLTTGPVAKVADFGLSRTLRDAYYVSSGKKPLPVRWMPLEAIMYSKFSSASDVWSFGVLLWEVLTKCQEIPFDELDTEDLLVAIEKGYRLQCPEGCPEDLYNQVMLACWRQDPHERPSFSDLLTTLRAMSQELKQQPATLPYAPQLSFKSRETVYKNYPVRYVDGDQGPRNDQRRSYEAFDTQPAQRHNSIVLNRQ